MGYFDDFNFPVMFISRKTFILVLVFARQYVQYTKINEQYNYPQSRNFGNESNITSQCLTQITKHKSTLLAYFEKDLKYKKQES